MQARQLTSISLKTCRTPLPRQSWKPGLGLPLGSNCTVPGIVFWSQRRAKPSRLNLTVGLSQAGCMWLRPLKRPRTSGRPYEFDLLDRSLELRDGPSSALASLVQSKLQSVWQPLGQWVFSYLTDELGFLFPLFNMGLDTPLLYDVFIVTFWFWFLILQH